MHETYYTPEQLAQLETRREEVGEDQIAASNASGPSSRRDARTNPI